MAVKFQGGKAVPANNPDNLQEIAQAIDEYVQVGRSALDVMAKLGVKYQTLKARALRSQDANFIQKVRQAEKNLDAALAGLRYAIRPIESEFE